MKRLLCLSVILVSILTLSACVDNKASDYVDKGVESTEKVKPISPLKELKDVKSVTLKKKSFSWGKSYEIKTDLGQVFYLKGKDFYWSGDVLELTDSKGKVLLKENQIARKVSNMNRMGEVKDLEDNTLGLLGESSKDFFSLTKKYHFYNQDGVEVALGVEKAMSFNPTFTISSLEGTEFYKLKERMSFTTTTDIEVLDSNTLPVEYAIIYAVIMAEIRSSED